MEINTLIVYSNIITKIMNHKNNLEKIKIIKILTNCLKEIFDSKITFYKKNNTSTISHCFYKTKNLIEFKEFIIKKKFEKNETNEKIEKNDKIEKKEFKFNFNGFVIDENHANCYYYFFNNFLSEIRSNIFCFKIDKILVLKNFLQILDFCFNIFLEFNLENSDSSYFENFDEIFFQIFFLPVLKKFREFLEEENKEEFLKVFQCFNENDYEDINDWFYDFEKLEDIMRAIN